MYKHKNKIKIKINTPSNKEFIDTHDAISPDMAGRCKVSKTTNWNPTRPEIPLSCKIRAGIREENIKKSF